MLCLKKIFVFIVFFLMIYCEVNADIPEYASRVLLIKEKDHLVSTFIDYKKQIFDLKNDLLELKADKEWLDINIMKFETQTRPVPDEMIKSRELNIQKQSTTHMEISRLESLCKQHLSILIKLDNKVKSGNNNKTPEWWRLDDQIYKIMYPGKKMANNDNVPLTPETETKKAESVAYYISPLKKEIEAKIQSANLENWVALIQNDKAVRLEIQLPILFGVGKYDVAKEYKTFFKKISTLLKPYQYRIEVAGYTNGDPTTTRNYSSKMELGTKRASSVVNEFVKTGISPALFKIISDGEYGANDPTKRALNPAMKRRVEVNIFFKDIKA